MTKSTSDTCLICNKTGAKRCAKCKDVAYCSVDCQLSDWPIHKVLCDMYSKLHTMSRPSNDYYLGIVFPVNSELRPALAWIHAPLEPPGLVLKRNPDHWILYPGGAGHQSPKTLDFLGGPAVEELPVTYNSYLKRDLPTFLNIAVRDHYLIDGSKKNGSIARLASETGRKDGDWRGGAVAFALADRQFFPAKIRDINLSDFRHIVDYFLSYSSMFTRAFPPHVSTEVTSVKINCFGDQTSNGLPLLEVWKGNVSQFKNFTRQTSDIAKLLSIPTFSYHFTYHLPPLHDPVYRTTSPFESEEIALLHLCCTPGLYDPNQGNMGWGKPTQKRDDWGSIVVIRQDLKTMHKVHAEALIGYARDEVKLLLVRATPGYQGHDKLDQEEVPPMINKKAFVAYWTNFIAEKRAGGDTKKYVSPYEV